VPDVLIIDEDSILNRIRIIVIIIVAINRIANMVASMVYLSPTAPHNQGNMIPPETPQSIIALVDRPTPFGNRLVAVAMMFGKNGPEPRSQAENKSESNGKHSQMIEKQAETVSRQTQRSYHY